MKKVILNSAVVLSALTLLAGPVLVAEATKTTSNKGDITFEKKDADDDTDNPIIDPVDPEKEDPVIDDEDDNDNGSTGPLKIDHITNFHFPTAKMSGNDTTYFAKAARVKEVDGTVKDAPNFVQVTDDRGSNAGWEVTVKQETPFSDGTNTIEKTTLHMKNLNVMLSTASNGNKATPPKMNANGIVSLSPGGTERSFASAEAEAGMGSWNMRIGEVATASKSVALDVPGIAKKVDGAKYVAELTWTIKDEPSKGN